MTDTNFDIEKFTTNMTSQVKDLIPSDINQETTDFITNTMDSFLRLAYEAISNDNELNPTNDDYILLLQIIAEWIFHKSVDISRAKVPYVHWDSIMQHIAFTIFEIVKQSWKREIPQDVLLTAVEHHINKCYRERLQELFDNKKITKEIFEVALSESNIDKMADETEKESNIKNVLGYESVDEMISAQASEKIEEIKKKNKEDLKKEQQRVKNALKNDEISQSKKTNQILRLFPKHVLGNYLEIFLGFLVICLESKVNLFILFSVSIFIFLYNHFSSSIAEFIIKYDFSLSTINFIVYFVSILIVGKIIVSSVMKAINDDIQKQLKELEGTRQKMQDLVNPDKQFERLGVDILRLEIGVGLLCIADPDQDGKLLANTAALRVELRDKLGYIIPNIRICDSSELENFEYQISVRDEVVASGWVYPNKYMVLADEWDSKVGKVPENVIYGADPVLVDTQVYWLDREDVKNHWDNITVVDPVGVIKKHLEAIVIKYVDSILTSCDIEKYIERVRKEENADKLIERLLERLELEDLRRIFVNLIREQVSIKDIIYVFDRLCEFSKYTQDPNILSERMRAAFGRQICLKCCEDKVLYTVTLSPELEHFLDNSIRKTEIGTFFDISSLLFQYLVESTAMTLMMAHQEIGIQPVILCPPRIRLPLYGLLVRHLPTIVILSYSELVTDIRVEKVDVIKFENEQIEVISNPKVLADEEFYGQELLLGRVIDSDGKPLDGGIENYSLEEMFSEIAPADSSEPAPITKIFKTGVRAVDAFITIGCGQKMGVFAANGCGASTFLSMILKNSEADINIVSLVANTVENAWSFINDWVKSEPNIQRKTIVICSTPLDSAEKIKKNFETAISLCEYYRDKGKNVLFINDKTEPILNAVEKIAWESGEPACENDYRLAVTTWYQSWINRCKNNNKGTITTILTVNTTSVDKNDKVVNIIRSATQGHVYVSRKIAEQNIYPAIDVLGSISRYQVNLLDNEQKAANMSIRKILALYQEKAAFFNSDKYVVGENPQNDFITRKYEEITSFIKQRVADNPNLEETLQGLVQLTSNVKFKKKEG